MRLSVPRFEARLHLQADLQSPRGQAREPVVGLREWLWMRLSMLRLLLWMSMAVLPTIPSGVLLPVTKTADAIRR